MRHLRRLALVFCAAALAAGCGGSSEPAPAEETLPDLPSLSADAIGDQSTDSLAALLDRPRAELAAQADEVLARVRVQDRARREGTVAFRLLPDLHLPLAVPVFREGKFSPEAGCTLPPYLQVGQRDAAVALHLARYGDVEAARRLAVGDAATLARIEEYKAERNYPVEWSRLVGLMLHEAQNRLAMGENEGATQIVALHRQLRTVLDARTAKGPLGADLLSRGRLTLEHAVTAWRSLNRPGIAEQAAGLLTDWGEVAPRDLDLPLGKSAADARAQLAAQERGYALLANSPLRALDLTGAPLPDEGTHAAVALVRDGKVGELLVFYKNVLTGLFPSPAHVGRLLDEGGHAGTDAAGLTGLARRDYPLGKARCEVAILQGSPYLGSYARFTADTISTSGSIPRDFGAAHLDRSFETMRLLLGPEQAGDVVKADKAKVLAKVANPLGAAKLTLAQVTHEAGRPAVDRILLRYAAPPTATPPLAQVALPLWETLGAAQLSVSAEGQGSWFVLTWEDERTSLRLRLPAAPGWGVEVEVRDRTPEAERVKRDAAVLKFDAEERRGRLAANKPLARNPRHLEIGWALEDQAVSLGMTREQVLQAIPGGNRVFKRDIPDGMAVTFTGERGRDQSYLARQLFIRFDAKGRTFELRGLFQSAEAGKPWAKALLDDLKKACGAPTTVDSAWVLAWPELPPQNPPPKLHQWHDDVTAVSYQIGSGAAEVVIRDRLSTESAPFAYLAPGPDACPIGEEKNALLARWGVTQPVVTPEGAVVLSPGRSSPYDALLVWFENDKVSRVVARYGHPRPGQVRRDELGRVLFDAWGRELVALGWPLRRDVLQGDALQGMGWLDDRVRVRRFWEDTAESGPRLFAEWRKR